MSEGHHPVAPPPAGSSSEVLVAMSGGVDSSVAAALLLDAGWRVTGVTMRLWGGPSDSGCCSVADVDDARRAADRLGIDHHVFNFAEEFERLVVDHYVAAHAAGRTPNPCIECNRSLKFDVLVARARALGFPALATGHHARVVERPDGTRRIARGADRAKDQSYVLYPVASDQLAMVRFPVGELTKDLVRMIAADRGLATAAKPDSQDVCFITRDGGRHRFLADRFPLTPGRIVDGDGTELGRVPAVQMVTIGQRRGLGLGGGERRYAVDVDVGAATITVGTRADLLADRVELVDLVWADRPVEGPVVAQVSAHGTPRAATVSGSTLRWHAPQPRVAPGQSVVFYEGDEVLGGGVVRDPCRREPNG